MQQYSDRNWAPEIGFEEIARMIKRRKKGIVALILASLIGGLVYHYTMPPEYHAIAMIMISDAKDPSNFSAAVVGSSNDGDNKASKKDAELITSMPIAELTVKELNKGSRREALEFLGKRKYLSPIAGVFHGILPFEILNAGQQTASASKNEKLLGRQALQLSKRIRVEPVRETNMLKVSVASPFPDEAALLTNTLCKVYKETNINLNAERYAQANRFIAEMLRDQQKKVTEADSALSAYMRKHEIYEVTGNTQHLLDKLVEADAKNKSVTAEYNIARNSLSFLEKKLSDSEKALSQQIAQNTNAQLGTIIDEIKGRELDYVKALREKGADAEDVKIKRQQLDVVKARYDQLSRSKIAGAIGYAGKSQRFNFDMISEKLQVERKMNDLSFSAIEFGKQKQYYEGQLSALPKKQQEFLRLQRDRDVVGKTYVALKEKLDETRILNGSEAGQVSVVGAAFQPFAPETPLDLSRSMLLGLLFGGLLASAYTYVAETLDGTIKDESFFKRAGLNTLAVIPGVTQNGKGGHADVRQGFMTRLNSKGKSGVIEKPLPLITESDDSLFVESFRTLRTTLDFYFLDRPLHSILVSGTAMSEGKSTICANLAIAYALLGKKTLIIDCELRRSSQHEKFNCKEAPGLTDYLVSESDVLDSSWLQPTQQNNLFLLSAGSAVSNPNELIGSSKMQHLLKELAGRFDKVLIDSPPLFLSDAAQLVPSVDGILLASRLQHTEKKPIQAFVDDPFFSPRILGVALITAEDSGPLGYGRLGDGKYEAIAKNS